MKKIITSITQNLWIRGGEIHLSFIWIDIWLTGFQIYYIPIKKNFKLAPVKALTCLTLLCILHIFKTWARIFLQLLRFLLPTIFFHHALRAWSWSHENCNHLDESGDMQAMHGHLPTVLKIKGSQNETEILHAYEMNRKNGLKLKCHIFLKKVDTACWILRRCKSVAAIMA